MVPSLQTVKAAQVLLGIQHDCALVVDVYLQRLTTEAKPARSRCEMSVSCCLSSVCDPARKRLRRRTTTPPGGTGHRDNQAPPALIVNRLAVEVFVANSSHCVWVDDWVTVTFSFGLVLAVLLQLRLLDRYCRLSAELRAELSSLQMSQCKGPRVGGIKGGRVPSNALPKASA